MRSLIYSVSAVLVTFILVTMQLDVKLNRSLREDYSKVLNIKYGLLNVDEWKNKSYSVITQHINEFKFNNSNRNTIRKQIEEVLYRILDEVELIVNEKSALGGIIPAKWVTAVRNIFVDFENLRSEVPSFTDSVLTELNDPRNQQELKSIVNKKLYQILDMGAERIDSDFRQFYFELYGCSNYIECGYIINKRIIAVEKRVDTKRNYILFIVGVVIILSLIPQNKIDFSEVGSLSMLSASFLYAGVLFPMISIDARVSDFDFKLLGMNVEFGEQVLFYQSKSIFEVVNLLIFENSIESVIVGLLILIFSIVFPVVKYILTVIYYFSQNSKVIYYIITNLSKWSMADVFVVGLIMAFIGMKSLIDSQIESIENGNPFIDVVATNNTSFEIGLICFTIYCVLSIILGQKMKIFPPNK